MNEQERKLLKEKIIETLAKTKGEILELEEMTKPISPENSIGRVSRINNKSVAEAALRTSRRKLNNLEYALTQIDAADFGNCSMCKRPIPPMRLMLMPQSRRCVRCADR